MDKWYCYTQATCTCKARSQLEQVREKAAARTDLNMQVAPRLPRFCFIIIVSSHTLFSLF